MVCCVVVCWSRLIVVCCSALSFVVALFDVRCLLSIRCCLLLGVFCCCVSCVVVVPCCRLLLCVVVRGVLFVC